jgi:alkylation response protein AidB-like acyl-CoA dehydrogenase
MTETLLDRARSLFGQIDGLAAGTAAGEPVADEALRLLDEAGLRGLLVPKAAGGLELPLVEVADLYEEVARADGSTGWVFFASDACASHFGAYLPDDGMEDVFADGVPLVAGQFSPNGTARVDGDDLWVDGDYQFGSGIVPATWAGGGVMTVPDEGGVAEYLGVCFPQPSAELAGNWDVLGLQATASYDYRVRGVRVPRSHSFDFLAPTVHRGSAVYSLGAITLTALGHAAWALGVTRRVLDELAGIAAETTRVGASSSLATSERFLYELGVLESRHRANRAWVREVVAAAEHDALAGAVSAMTGALLRAACRHVNQDGADIARQAYLLAGTRALRAGPIQRGFRDLHAGSQHFYASPFQANALASLVLAEHGGV